ncbi:MAG TPA: Ig-like domain-containing protein [Thermoplasmata archaeon]|nr:Ig-like domain-containing protein [Thermoplasmata archaeon]
MRHLAFGLHGESRTLAILLAILLGATILGLVPQAAAAGPGVGCPVGKVYRSGTISGMQIWDATSTTVMKGNVTVSPAATLTINAGACVLADPSVHLYVDAGGTLRADGSSIGIISFAANKSSPWGGIQFNRSVAGGSSFGSVSWSTFDRADRAVTVFGPSSPWIHDNTVIQAGVGFVFLQGSTSNLNGNTIRRATSFGVYVNASSIQVTNNQINGTPVAIELEQPGASTVSSNTITNVSSTFAVGIGVWYGATANIFSNTIRGVRGAAGADASTNGANGRDGGTALGVFVNAAPSASISFNTIDALFGGNAGNGAANTTAGGTGGRGGKGGAAAGIVVANTPSVSLFANTIQWLVGGRGGAGGGSAATNTGGRGGDAGEAVGLEIFTATISGGASFTTITGLTGGNGGNGGTGSARDGSGGAGGDTNGVLLISVAQADSSVSSIKILRGGLGGNSTVVATAANGGRGGDATGISVIPVIGSAFVHASTIDTLSGGDAGRGQIGGRGGNATGVIGFGNNDRRFNATTISSGYIATLTGGIGGLGRTRGGDGGSATGIGVIFVSPTLNSNVLLTLQGGRGGNGGAGAIAGRGGDAQGIIGGLVANGLSTLDSITTVTRGAAGTGTSPGTSYGIGFQFIGNATYTSRFTVDNGTFSSVGNYEFFVNNYTRAVSINTTFTKVAVMNAGNLTVRNYIDGRALWPNGVSLVAGARVIVQDNGVEVWNRTAATGDQPWVLVTNRVYVRSNNPTYNVTRARITYLAYSFANSPRNPNMNTSHVESFVMVDIDPPTSSASPLSTYKNSTSFFVNYTASDGNGKGLGNITLWYRQGESVVWIKFVTQAASPSGQFAFVAPSNGHFEFATTADDLAGNKQPGPTTNNTWTMIDTVAPGSHVNPLTSYKNSMSFTVSWAPDVGVTDIASYTIQYKSSSGWVNWIVGTTATSATFTATTEGMYAFRSIAIDRAGNWEVPPTGNDTWTIVDVTRPTVTAYVPTATNATTSAIIQITFSEPMDRASVEKAFTISGGMNGTFQWSSDSRSVTFLPSRALQAGTTYTVVLGTTATDRAGNQMLNPLTFQFSTAAAPPSGLALSSFWWLLPILAAVVGAALFLIMRRRSVSAPKPVAPAPAASKVKEAILEDLFLLNHKDGLLIKHETRRLRPDVDTDILTGMLTAVQQFVKDALRGDDYADLNEMTVGQMHILIGRGKWLVLAARIEGDGSPPWTASIERCIKDMEDHHWDQLEDWDGDMAIARVLTPYLKKLIDGGYSAPNA